MVVYLPRTPRGAFFLLEPIDTLILHLYLQLIGRGKPTLDEMNTSFYTTAPCPTEPFSVLLGQRFIPAIPISLAGCSLIRGRVND